MVLLLEVLAVLAVVFGVAVVLTGRAEGLSDEPPDLADIGLPRDRTMTADDVVGLRFGLAFRGYRMAEVDDALDRLAAEIAARDEAIARLRAGAAPAPAPEAEETTVADEYVPSDATGDVPSGTAAGAAAPWEASPDAPPAPEYVPSDATGDVAPGTPVDPPPPPVDLEPDPVTPAFQEPPAPEPAPDAAPDAAPDVPSPLTAPPPPSPLTTASPFRPEVPDVPAYDPWAVTPRSRYTDGPTYVEVEHDDDHDPVDAIAEHQTGYAPAPEPAAPAEDAPGAPERDA